MQLRSTTARIVSVVLVSMLSTSTVLTGCSIGNSAKGADASSTQSAQQAPSNGWDTAEEVAWTDAQQVLDSAAENFSDTYDIDLDIYLRVIAGPYKGLTASVGNDDKRYSASTIKAPLVVTALKKFGDDLSHSVTVDWDDAVGGSVLGVGSYTVETLLSYIMAYSDNTAANGLIDTVGGFEPVNETIRKAGVNEDLYHMGNKFNIPSSNGDRNWFTPSQAALFMNRLQEAADGSTKYNFVDQETAQTALKYLTGGGAQKFAMLVGSAVQKTGDTEAGVNDHGILYTSAGPIAFGITTRFNRAPLNELTDALLGRIGAQIVGLLPDYNQLGADGKPLTAKQAAVWSKDADEDGIPDRQNSASQNESGSDSQPSTKMDDPMEPDWFNPYRSKSS